MTFRQRTIRPEYFTSHVTEGRLIEPKHFYQKMFGAKRRRPRL